MIKLIVMRVQSCQNILQDFPVCKLGEGKTEKLVVTGKEILLDTQDSFPYLQSTQKQLLINTIIAFGVSKYDEMVTIFQKKFPMPVAASFEGERWCYFDTRPGGRVVVLERR